MFAVTGCSHEAIYGDGEKRGKQIRQDIDTTTPADSSSRSAGNNNLKPSVAKKGLHSKDVFGGGEGFVPFTQSEIDNLLLRCTPHELEIVVVDLKPEEFAQLIHTATPQQRAQFVQIVGPAGMHDLSQSFSAGEQNQFQQSVSGSEFQDAMDFLNQYCP